LDAPLRWDLETQFHMLGELEQCCDHPPRPSDSSPIEGKPGSPKHEEACSAKRASHRTGRSPTSIRSQARLPSLKHGRAGAQQLIHQERPEPDSASANQATPDARNLAPRPQLEAAADPNRARPDPIDARGAQAGPKCEPIF